MKKLILLLFLFISPFASAETFVNATYGLTWYQYDYNSNHGDKAWGFDVGKRLKNGNLLLGYLNTDSTYRAVSAAANTPNTLQWNEIDHSLQTIMLWYMPRAEWGNLEVSAGPGLGLIYDTVSLITEAGVRSERKNDFALNVGLRADIRYFISERVSLGFSYQHHYFEVDINRAVSDYEVNQDRVFYLGYVSVLFGD